jgi:hypothetical protein
MRCAAQPSTVYRKATNGFPAEWAAKLYADVRTCDKTGRRRSVRAIDAIHLIPASAHMPPVGLSAGLNAGLTRAYPLKAYTY